jgi:hypothetical protein
MTPAGTSEIRTLTATGQSPIQPAEDVIVKRRASDDANQVDAEGTHDHLLLLMDKRPRENSISFSLILLSVV